ncbi:signal transduction protein with Nacht domain protein [Streptomyces sp. Act143]|uniref:HEAT repeat domain-containing protein n=1 Tax=Streptomyces sp. Act143 TaxID=2200760 RepID=UPI000D674308|nr:HEAT repeat domain-containing protein [Streptomyces sp. Act143]PWI17404.1 signal transduction protein with Nacht domain protein [Streptomyces sp. Act143]
MARDTEQVTAGGERAVGAGGDVKVAVTGDLSSGTYIENLYVQQTPAPAAVSDAEAEDALRRYAGRVRETYGRLDLEVLIPTEEGEHPPVGLDEVFVAPTVRADPPPVELPRDIRQRLADAGEWPASLPPGLEREALERARRAYAERPARDALDVLADPAESRLVLLGDPGAGKSTLARHLALALTQEALAAGDPLTPLAGRVPLVVELREYAVGEWRERTFEDFLAYLHNTKGMAPPRPVVARLLAEGRAVVVFDGLDELFDPAARQQVSHRIADFADRYGGPGGVRVVVTSRVIGYRRGVLEHAGFSHHMVQDLSTRQITRFARQWYATAYPHDEERAARLCRRLTEAVGHSRPVAELAGNPLLLTILAIVGRRRELPRDRQGVYRHAVAVLVAHWDEHAKHLRAPNDVEALSYLGDEDRHELLRLVARRMQEGEGGIAGNHIHHDVLLETFRDYLREQYELPLAQAVSAARAMVRQFHDRNFILSHYGGGVYGFVHRAFLEYLAAVDIDHRYTREREWTPEEFIEEIFAGHADDPAWHEVLLLVVGQLGEREAGAAVDRLLELHRRRVGMVWKGGLLALAVRALAEVRRLGALTAQSRAVVDAIIMGLESADSRFGLLFDDEGIVSALGTFPPHWSGRPRLLRWFHLRGQFRHRPQPGRIAAALYQGTAWPKAMAVLADVTHARKALLEMLAARWGHEQDVRRLLQEGAVAEPDEYVRKAALGLLAEIDGAEVSELVKDRSIADPSLVVRAFALSMRDDAEELWEPFLEIVRSRGNAHERAEVVDLLAEHRIQDPVVGVLLCRLAVEDPGDDVRQRAVAGLESLLDDKDVRALIRDRVTGDPSAVVRNRAMLLLVEQFGDWEVARRAAVEDNHWYVRTDALFALRTLGRDDADTWAFLRQRALRDLNSRVRSVACTVLAQTTGSHPGTWEFLRGRLAEDSSGQVRDSALSGLVKLGEDKEETWQIVRERLRDDPNHDVRESALTDLCGYRSDEAVTWELACDLLVNDPHDGVRAEALRATRHCRGAADTQALIRTRVAEDPSPRVREVALALLATTAGDDDTTRELLGVRALDDPDPRIRAVVLQWWAVRETGENGAAFLRDRAVADPHPWPRIAAVQSLAFGWPAHPATVPLLRERAEADEDEDVRTEAVRAVATAGALAPLAEQLP